MQEGDAALPALLNHLYLAILVEEFLFS